MPRSTARTTTRLAAVGVGVLLVLLSACGTPKVSAPAAKDLPVDTPELVALKAAARLDECTPGTGSPSATKLPDLTLPCLGGGAAVNLATLTGPLVINVWSSACKPCRKEMPALGAFYQQYGDQVPILGIDLSDTYPGVALKQAKKRGATYPQLFDFDGKIQATSARVPGLPTFLFLAADGTLTRQSGGLESLDEVVAMVNTQLGTTLG